jgi:hypothetical protein
MKTRSPAPLCFAVMFILLLISLPPALAHDYDPCEPPGPGNPFSGLIMRMDPVQRAEACQQARAAFEHQHRVDAAAQEARDAAPSTWRGSTADDQSPSYQQGRADRLAWEQWFGTLGGDTRLGAVYWTGERHKPAPGNCVGTPEFQQGCALARQRLATPDVRRKTEPQYWYGWNSLSSGSAAYAAADAPTAPRSSSDTPWYLVSTTQGRCTRLSDVFPEKGQTFPSTPAGIVSSVRGGSAYVMDQPGYGPAGAEHHPPGPVVRLASLVGNLPTLALVQGEASCREALALMMKVGTAGSVEQRWAAQNAERDAQWHVVYWNNATVPCTPLAEFVHGAISPDEALAVIRRGDPDAYLVDEDTPGQWERILRTRGHNLRVVRTALDCRHWFSLMSE